MWFFLVWAFVLLRLDQEPVRLLGNEIGIACRVALAGVFFADYTPVYHARKLI